MTSTRPGSPATPALVLLSVAVCVGAAAEAAAAGQPAPLDTQRLGQAERQAFACLLACVSDTVRQLKRHGQSDTLALPGVGHQSADVITTTDGAGIIAPSAAPFDPLGPRTLTRRHLLNLPPPTAGHA